MILSPIEQTLIERVKCGEHRSFYKFVENYSSIAYRYTLRLIQDPEKAYDICSAAFIRAFTLMKSSSSTQMTFRTWLYRIITCCYLEAMRKEQHSRFKLKSMLHLSEQKETLGDIKEKLLNKSSSIMIPKSLLDALNSLTYPQKIMIILSYSEKLSIEEIAQVLDLPLNTIKRRLDYVHFLLAKNWAI